ncbi:MAG: bifunctional aldolase/short-chain dehydrogenase [Bacteroidetes bacterium]|nr:bifunctional aldolase/short-chain dehydrogenase [Bacteroidota bacterium]
MKNLWNHKEALRSGNSLLRQRIYTSRLLGMNPDLVLHGGGNTSVKIKEKNIFGEEEDILYVKGSGADLATIDEPGFSPVRLNVLMKLSELDHLSDTDMVKYERTAMTNPDSPAPSIEAIVHALIPFTFVDHTHADAIVTVTNTKNGLQRIKEIYGDRVLIIPYVMPGFLLAKEIYRQCRNFDWNKIEGMILMNHGVFTFHDTAKGSYDLMIKLVTEAELFLKKNNAAVKGIAKKTEPNPGEIAGIRRKMRDLTGKSFFVISDASGECVAFSGHPQVKELSQRGTLTPDHVIRIKPFPACISSQSEKDIERFAGEYMDYFDKFNNGSLTPLDSAPRWAIIQGKGLLFFGKTVREAEIVRDICLHNIRSMQQGEMLGGYLPLSRKDLFAIEYWELEQAKLRKNISTKSMSGRIALVTGAASGIGKACVEKLLLEGAAVSALDINPSVLSIFSQKEVLAHKCDVDDFRAVGTAIKSTVMHFGGLDMVVSNAGIFTESCLIEEMNLSAWNQSMRLNLGSHMNLLKTCIPFLSKGIDPAVVIIASKNVPAPGPGVSAYSVAKAGLTQLARVAALELGKKGIRVNVVHPNAVFDTGAWNEKILSERARHYKMSVEEYQTNNILKTAVNSSDVSEVVFSLLSRSFAKTTGAQIPVDGGNERVI